MPQIITIGGFFRKSLLRVNTDKNIVEVSENGGNSWSSRFTSPNCGTFRDLLLYKGNVFLCTSKGLYISTNDGKSFSPRYNNSSAGEFLSLQDNGKELLATTTKGLYWSTNEGKTWTRR